MVRSLKYLGKGSFWCCGQSVLQIIKHLGKVCGQRLLQIIRLNTLVDIIRVPKVRTSGEELLIDTNFVRRC